MLDGKKILSICPNKEDQKFKWETKLKEQFQVQTCIPPFSNLALLADLGAMSCM